MIALLSRFLGTTRERTDEQDIPGVDVVSFEEARAIFDRRARHVLGISGDEFLKRWDAGEFRPVPDTPEGRKVGTLVMMMPLARRTKS